MNLIAHAFLTAATFVSFGAMAADSGNLTLSSTSETVPARIVVSESNASCSKVDSWGESDLIIYLGGSSGVPSSFNVITRTYVGGDCESDLAALIASSDAQGGIHGEVQIETTESLVWGVYNGGSNYEEKFCHKSKRVAIYLQGDRLFPQYQFQSRSIDESEKLPYDDCVRASK